MADIDFGEFVPLGILTLMAMLVQMIVTAIIGNIPNIPFLTFGVAAFYVFAVVVLKHMVDIDNLIQEGRGLIVFAMVGLAQLGLVTFGFIPANSPLLLGEALGTGFFGIVFTAVQIMFYLMAGELVYEQVLHKQIV